MVEIFQRGTDCFNVKKTQFLTDMVIVHIVCQNNNPAVTSVHRNTNQSAAQAVRKFAAYTFPGR